MGANDKAEATFHPRREVAFEVLMTANGTRNWHQISDEWSDSMHQLVKVLEEAVDSFDDFLERVPGFWGCLYHATDFFWRSDGWQLLWWRINNPKRKIRRIRADRKAAQHIRWAADLKESGKHGTYTTSYRAAVPGLPYLFSRLEADGRGPGGEVLRPASPVHPVRHDAPVQDRQEDR